MISFFRSRVMRRAGWISIIGILLLVRHEVWPPEDGTRGQGDSPKAPAVVEHSSDSASANVPQLSTRSSATAPAANPLPSKVAARAVRAPGSHRAPDAPAAPDAQPLTLLLGGKPFTLLDRGHPATFELALDELYLPSVPIDDRLRKFAPQADAAGLLQMAQRLAAAGNVLPNLVVYLAGQPRNELTRRIVTDQLLLQVHDPNAADQIARAANLRITSRPAYAPGYVIAETQTAAVASGLDAISRLAGLEGVVSAAPLLARQQVPKTTLPNDTLFSQQWHLRNTGQGGGTVGSDAAVTGVWDDYQGAGITIGIIDNGVQLTHPDIAPNADATHHFDWNDSPNDTNPAPNTSVNFHGTSVAGVAAARGGNGIGVSGAAPQSTLVGFRLIAASTTDLEEADAMSLHNAIIDIKNNSWGPPDDEPWILGTAGPLLLAALQDGVTNGRGGKGVIYTWAAGNGRGFGDQSNKDAYANSICVLAVGALTNTNTASSYSEFGSNLVVSAPSSGGTLDIVTTDLVGDDGYNPDFSSGDLSDENYTNSFGGTSSASPLVSGVVALMLEANPNLTWRDVKEILLRTSNRILPADPGWVSRSAGDPSLPAIQHHEQYGGGRINAQAAVGMAASWPPRPPMIQVSDSRTYGNPGTAIPDNNKTGVQTSFDMSGKPAMRVEHVEVTVTATHTYRGDLQITLISPGGVVSTLATVTSADEDFGSQQEYDGWTFSSVRHWGESSPGVWKVAVKDLAFGDTGNLASVAIRISGTAALPRELVVEQPAGTILDNGGAEIDFGNVATDNSALKTFTVKNVGDLPLGSVAVAIDGPNEAEYILTSSLGTTLNGSSLATLQVQFAPTATGLRQATLHITSDDPDESSFDIPLSGTGTPTVGFLAFGAAGFTVNETDGTIELPVKRTGGTFGPVSVGATTTNGTAVEPGDFTALTDAPVDFADGAVNGTISVSIEDGASSEVNKTFTVTLSNPTNGARLGSIVQVPVTIIDSTALSKMTDMAAPGAPAVSAPAANALVGVLPGDMVSILGTALDNKGVKQVQVSLNGASFIDATLGIPGAPSTAFSAMLLPVTGPNTLEVVSFDYAGRVSSTVTRTFRVARPLAVNVDTNLGSVTTGFAPSSFREVGQKFIITAIALPPTTSPPFDGAIFTGWTLGGSDVAKGGIAFTPQRLGLISSALNKGTLSFIFREGLVITASFVDNPFTPLAGNYNGLIHPSLTKPDRIPFDKDPGPEDGTASTNSTEGFFTATVGSTGAFSGKLTIDSFSLYVAGAFDINGDARFGTSRSLTQAVARINKPSLIVALQLDLTSAGTGGKMTGSVTATDFRRNVTAVSSVNADRAHYNGTSPIVPGDYLGAANANGIFTAVFPAKDTSHQPAGFTTLDYPQGDGTATITVTKAGAITLAGTLADGSLVAASSALSKANTFPLFAQLYNKLGFLSGQVALDHALPASDMTATDLKWLRPLILTTQYYPFGWPVPIKVDLMAAKYAVGSGQSMLKAADGDNIQIADADGNATLAFSDGQLPEARTRSVKISIADAVTNVPVDDTTFSLKINRTTGAISGSFTHDDFTKPSFNGIIYQKGPDAGAYGFFLTKLPAIIDYTGESGGVSLIGQPP